MPQKDVASLDAQRASSAPHAVEASKLRGVAGFSAQISGAEMSEARPPRYFDRALGQSSTAESLRDRRLEAQPRRLPGPEGPSRMLEEPTISSPYGPPNGTEVEHQDPDQIVNIRLGESERLCFDISNAPNAGKPGMEWNLWDCAPDPALWDEYSIPLHGHIGPIKPLKYPSFCLGKRGGTQPVSFQPCDTLPLSLMLWMVNKDEVRNLQRVHFAADVSRCLGVSFSSDTPTTRGELVRLQKCAQADAAEGQILLIQPAPVDCVWGDWTTWSTCSRLCGVGNTIRSRVIFRKAKYDGQMCQGGWKEQKMCHGTGCPGGSPEEEIGAAGAWYANPRLVHVLAFLAAFLCCWLSVLMLKKFRIRMVLVDPQRKEGPEDDDELSEGDSRTGLLHAPGNSQVSPEARLASLRGELPGAGRSGGTPPARALQRGTSPAQAGQFDSGVQTTVATCPLRHQLKEVVGAQAKKRWSCDAQSCPHGRASLGKHGVRYRCDGCDFDLCEQCYTRQLVGQQGASLPTSPGSGREPVSPARERSSSGSRWIRQQRGESQERQLVDLGPGCTASVPSPPRSAGTRGSGSPSGAQSPQSRGTSSPS